MVPTKMVALLVHWPLDTRNATRPGTSRNLQLSNIPWALASVAQLVGAPSPTERSQVQFPVRAQYLGCGFDPQSGCRSMRPPAWMRRTPGPGRCGRHVINASLTSLFLSLPLSVKRNEEKCTRVRTKIIIIISTTTIIITLGALRVALPLSLPHWGLPTPILSTPVPAEPRGADRLDLQPWDPQNGSLCVTSVTAERH